MKTITIKDLRKVLEDCWFKIITDTEDGEEVIIFDQEVVKSNIPSFLEELPVTVAYIDDENSGIIKIYIHNDYENLYEEEEEN